MLGIDACLLGTAGGGHPLKKVFKDNHEEHPNKGSELCTHPNKIVGLGHQQKTARHCYWNKTKSPPVPISLCLVGVNI